MKIKVVKDFGEWSVEIKQGHQAFRLGIGDEDKAGAEWFAKMFRKALKNHDEEKNNAGKK
jgi:hypothetical protein